MLKKAIVKRCPSRAASMDFAFRPSSVLFRNKSDFSFAKLICTHVSNYIWSIQIKIQIQLQLNLLDYEGYVEIMGCYVKIIIVNVRLLAKCPHWKWRAAVSLAKTLIDADIPISAMHLSEQNAS